MSECHSAPCGLDCALCDIFKATQADSDEQREMIARKWTEMFHYPFQKKEINCDGCLNDGRKGIYCGTMCEVRPCALQKGITDCRDCPGNPCEKLRKNHEASAAYTQDEK